ncbi:YfjI family protein [Streptomyces olivoreticuli]|uniref:YfjI family protein n=1 Tax=Streptomyces olivoreticuli TaxID=68246 RepID=UPI00265A3EDD|nr:YfjI family protein [Streptomyces olivoreticuli]WKK24690.1 YfjI family protein [Streptomyces olivoreticuli]
MSPSQETDLWEGFDALAAEEVTGPVWDEPVPLTACWDLPAFPVDILPGWLADMVTAVAEETQTPTDLAGCLALSVLATAAGGRAVVCVRGRWREPLNLFTAIALDPGNRKSAVFALMTEPLMAVEKTLVELSGAARAEAETTARLAKAAADKAAAKAANADAQTRDQFTAEAIELAQAAEEVKVPCKPQLVADDVTPENLATLLTEQDGRISVLSPEGGIFEIIAGRYSGAPNMEIFLKGHAGDMVRVNRQGRDAQHIERPAITMGLAVQPEVLESIGQIKGADGRGLLARFLYALPESLVGHRNLTPDLIPDAVADTYAQRLGGLALAMAGWTDPAILTLTSGADAVLLAYQKVTEARIGKGGALAPIVKWASKRDGAVARIAGLLHLATHPDQGWTKSIDAATMAAATRLGDYFTAHAHNVFDAMGADPAQEAAHQVLAHLRDVQLSGFTKRELFRGLSRGDFPAIADLDPALALLEEHGWLRQQPPPPRTGRGGRPPSPRYESHPRLTRVPVGNPPQD